MKRKIVCLLILGCISLTACEKKNDEKIEIASFEDIIVDEVQTPAVEEPTRTEAPTQEPTQEPTVPIEAVIDNPGWSYYIDKENAMQVDKPVKIRLEQVSAKTNQITDTDEWFNNNDLNNACCRRGQIWSDDTYIYKAYGDVYYAHILYIYDKNDKLVKCYDFTQFQYADNYKKEDYDFIDQFIKFAKAEDNILYVGFGHNTYANSCPDNAYVFAIDMNTNKVIWKTQPLTSNSNSFAIIGDNIVCGYGFTDEPDYLYILDKYTGERLESIKLKTGPDYIIEKDNKLYVRTYNTDYVFDIK